MFTILTVCLARTGPHPATERAWQCLFPPVLPLTPKHASFPRIALTKSCKISSFCELFHGGDGFGGPFSGLTMNKENGRSIRGWSSQEKRAGLMAGNDVIVILLTIASSASWASASLSALGYRHGTENAKSTQSSRGRFALRSRRKRQVGNKSPSEHERFSGTDLPLTDTRVRDRRSQ